MKLIKVCFALYLTVFGSIMAVNQAHRQAAKDKELHEYHSVMLQLKLFELHATATTQDVPEKPGNEL